VTTSTLDIAAATIKRWRTAPRGILQFVHEQFGVTPDPWQEQALLAFASPKPEYRRISLQACVGPGKTAVLAWCAWWFLGVQGDAREHPQGACVAITGDNLRDNLWKELAKWQQQSAYLKAGFTWTATRIFANDHPETWFLSARSWPKSANADVQGATLSGLHSKYVLVLADESGAIPIPILRAGEQAMSTGGGGFAKFMQAGNPLSLEGMLYAAAVTLRGQWHVIRVTGDPSDPHAWVHNPRVGDRPKEWAAQQIETYGVENPWVKSYILGQFPAASVNSLLGVEEVEAAMKRHLRPQEYDFQQKRLGVDVARFGDDRTVLFPRWGLASFKPVVLRHLRTTDIAARIMLGINRWQPGLILIDDTGHWGHGVLDNLISAGVPCIGINYAGKALNPRYRNRRAEFWIEGAKAIRNGAALPYNAEMIAELTTPTYTFVNGVFVLEEKDFIKARLGRSPDLADAYMQTYAMPEMPADAIELLGGQRGNTRGSVGHAATDFDPYISDDNRRSEDDFDPWK